MTPTARLSIWFLLLASVFRSAAADDGTSMVHRDWYFRESLAAIRDWEDLLGRWEQDTPESARTPVLPVPASGEAVAWPNPIPRQLLPPDGISHSVGVRCRDGTDAGRATGAGSAAQQEEVAAGAEVLGYQHPGGGGKDQWYHAYHRRFDRLTRFRPQPARFSLRVAAPLDLLRGENELAMEVRSAVQQPLTLRVHGEFRTPGETRDLGEQALELAAGATAVWRLPLRLDAPGGGLVIVSIRDGDQAYWLPLLTHVEEVADVLASIGQILADTPDAAAAQELAGLQRRADQWSAGGAAAGAAWRQLFEEASRLRDELLLGRVRFDTLLFVKRKPFFSEQPFMDAHHLFNRPGRRHLSACRRCGPTAA